MYFDLEFARDCNPGLDGEELVRAWINVVAGETTVVLYVCVTCFAKGLWGAWGKCCRPKSGENSTSNIIVTDVVLEERTTNK